MRLYTFVVASYFLEKKNNWINVWRDTKVFLARSIQVARKGVAFLGGRDMPENLKTMTGFSEGEKESHARLCVQREGRLQAALPRSSSMKHGVRGAATTREPRRCT